MIGKFITLLLISASCVLSAADFAAERYTKVKSGSRQKIYSLTKNNGCYSTDIPLNGGLPVIILDEDIYRQLNQNAANIAVVSGENQLIPFVMQKLYQWDKRIKYTPLSGKIVGFKVDKERNEAVIDYQLNSTAATAVGKLSLHPYGRKKFNKTVTLEFDNQTRVENLKFFNHTSVVDFSRHTFEFAPGKTRNIRIIIAPFAEKHSSGSALIRSGNKENFSETQIFTDELSLNNITFYQAETQFYPALELTQIKTFLRKETDKKDSKSHLEFDLGSYPVKRLKIASSTPNYHRQYTLEFRQKAENTREDGEYIVLRRFSGTLTPGSNIEFNDIRADKAILTIENNADAPLADLSFKWTVPQEALVLDQNADLQDFKLYYGGDVDKLPEFDFKHYVDKFKGCEYYKLALYNEEANPLFKPAGQTANDLLKKLLPYIITFAAIIIAFISFKMLKKVNVENDNCDC